MESRNPRADLIAKAIKSSGTPIETTQDLARIIRATLAAAFGKRAKEEIDASLRRVFQALRIAVNDEFSALETFLRNLPLCLTSGGRVAILSFHSGEDRRVKKAFQAGLRAGDYSTIANEVIRPSPRETRDNPRSSSAKLRWAIRT